MYAQIPYRSDIGNRYSADNLPIRYLSNFLNIGISVPIGLSADKVINRPIHQPISDSVLANLLLVCDQYKFYQADISVIGRYISNWAIEIVSCRYVFIGFIGISFSADIVIGRYKKNLYRAHTSCDSHVQGGDVRCHPDIEKHAKRAELASAARSACYSVSGVTYYVPTQYNCQESEPRNNSSAAKVPFTQPADVMRPYFSH